MGFTKLFEDIVSSSIWNEDDKTRLVWITLLALKKGNHVAHASVGGLAHMARVSVQDCQKAIDKLTAPDPDSRTEDYEGRRIEKVPGGFLILNGELYRQKRDEDDRKAYMAEYMKGYRRKQSVNNRKHE